MGSPAENDICTCQVCRHYRATVCYENKCNCCRKMDEEYLRIYADDMMVD